MHPYYAILTFCSVGLGSYLRAHVCHSYPGPLYCVASLLNSLSSIITLSLSQLALFNNHHVVVSFVLVLVIPSIINVVPSIYLFPLSVVLVSCLDSTISTGSISGSRVSVWVAIARLITAETVPSGRSINAMWYVVEKLLHVPGRLHCYLDALFFFFLMFI